jgi:hypothetical protein
MTIALHVRWPNAASPLLGGVTVTVVADGAEVTADSQRSGEHRFTIPDGSASVRVAVEFRPTLTVTSGSGSFVVLRADQAYVVDGTTLLPDPLPFRMENGEVVVQNVHPLIDSISTGNAASGLTIAEVRTEFVDLSEMWKAHAHPHSLDVYEAETEREIAFVPIGATGSTPPLWFSLFPVGMTPPSSEINTLTFFRPAAKKGYTQPFDVDDFETQNAINRYMLAPRDSRTPTIINGVPEARDPNSFFFEFGKIFLRASFQRAMVNSGKPLVLFHPWPQGGTNFGDAATAKLPTLHQGMLRLLRGHGHIASVFPFVTPGRMGLSGYSAGGPATIAALRANAPLVRELYLFDPMFLATGADAVVQWAARTPDFRLRMTGEVAFGAMHAIAASVRQLVTGEAGDTFLTALPETRRRWEPAARGGWDWWNFSIGFRSELQQSFDRHHQFALYGGQKFETAADGTVLSFTTFLEEFLNGSGF